MSSLIVANDPEVVVQAIGYVVPNPQVRAKRIGERQRWVGSSPGFHIMVDVMVNPSEGHFAVLVQLKPKLNIPSDITDQPVDSRKHNPALIRIELGNQSALALAIHAHDNFVLFLSLLGNRENRAALVGPNPCFGAYWRGAPALSGPANLRFGHVSARRDAANRRRRICRQLAQHAPLGDRQIMMFGEHLLELPIEQSMEKIDAKGEKVLDLPFTGIGSEPVTATKPLFGIRIGRSAGSIGELRK